MLKNRKLAIWILSFLGFEGILYILLLFTGGKVEILSSYLSIVFCFLFALLHIRSGKPLLPSPRLTTICVSPSQ